MIDNCCEAGGGGGGGTPGGSNTQPQYNNAGAFGGMSGITWESGTSTYTFGGAVVTQWSGATSGTTTVQSPAVAGNAVITWPGVTSTLATLGANTFTDSQTLTTGTKTTNTPIISGTQTWNAGAVVFDADLINVTDNASASSSYLIRRQLGGVDRFSVAKSGYMVSARAATDGAIQLGSDGTFYLYRIGSIFNIVGAGQIVAQANELRIGYLSLGGAGSSYDALITRAGAAQIQIGAADAASPVAQTLQAQGSRTGTDSNVAGSPLKIRPGKGTGNAAPGALILQSYVAVASGSGAQTATDTLTLNSGTATFTGNVTITANGLTTTAVPVATLPSAAAYSGTRIYVNDATMSLLAGTGTTVAGGGANVVPVGSNASNWIIGG